MADIPASGKAISDFTTGTVSSGTLFPAAFPAPGVGAVTGKISASELGQGMGENIQFNGLNTINKTIFGAINELKTMDPTISDIRIVRIRAGSIVVGDYDSFYDPDATYDIYTDYFKAKITNLTIIQAFGTYGIGISLQAALAFDINVLIVKRG